MSIDKINFDGTEIEIPRKTSQLTNDNNFITLSDIPTASNATLGLIKLATTQEITDGTNETNAVTPKQLKTAIEGIGTVFDLKGSVDTLGDLPTENNEIGDVWYVKSESVGYIWLNDGMENRWEQLGPSINLSNYVQITDIVNDLTTDDIEKPLSAYQGKVLNESILNVSQSIPTNTSQLTNDSGYITGYTETDPTVPDWAKQSTKPTYTYSEITEKPTLATVATSGSYDDLTNKPNIPSAVTVDSALSTTSENPVQNKVVTSAINTAQSTANTAQSTAETANTNAQNAQSTANTALTTANGAVSKNTEQDASISALQTADGQNVKLTGTQTIDGLKTFKNCIILETTTGTFLQKINIDSIGRLCFDEIPYIVNQPIISSGSNANGDWIRFSDGTQICYGQLQKSENVLVSLPLAFIDTNYRVCCQHAHGAMRGNYTNTGDVRDKTTTSFKFNANHSEHDYYDWIAIGKWK